MMKEVLGSLDRAVVLCEILLIRLELQEIKQKEARTPIEEPD